MLWSGAVDAFAGGGDDGPAAAPSEAAVSGAVPDVVAGSAAVPGGALGLRLPPHGFMEPSSVAFSGFLSLAGGPIVSVLAPLRSWADRQPKVLRTCFHADVASEL